MRKFILLFSFYLISCSSKTERNVSNQAEFPIDSIIKITQGPIDIVKIHSFNLEKLAKIDFSFFNKYFEGQPVAGQDTLKLRYNYQPFWYFVDHRDMGDKIMFSILSDNESGYSLMYYLLFDKTSKKILSVNNLTTYEGDGDYYNIDSLIWINNKFISYSISGGSEELNDSLTIQFKDSSCYEYILTKNKFISKKIYTYSTKDTIDYRTNNN